MNVPHFAVVGSPVDQSRSPEIFSALSLMTNRPLTYERLLIEPSAFVRTMHERRADFAGWNVTAPHKSAALRAADSASADAQLVGAANVLTFSRAMITATNSDVAGCIALLERNRIVVRGARIRVLGAGGASRAVVVALARMGAREIIVMNRTQSRAEQLVAGLRSACKTTKLTASTDAGDVAVVINATSDGAAVADWTSTAEHRGWCVDLQYAVGETPFVRSARAQGRSAVGGTDMLVAQALATFRGWFPDVALDERSAFERLARIVVAA